MKINYCRLCRGILSEPKLILPPTPLANNFTKQPQQQQLFPLEICVCQSCEHYQLNESIEPEKLFREYCYVSGTSSENIKHFKNCAIEIIKTFAAVSDKYQVDMKVLDIASNDGTLLKHFQDLSVHVLGIDPAVNLATEATKNGIPTIPEFFTKEYAKKILIEHGKFDIITAMNVCAHVPDLINFVLGVEKLLAPNGIFVFEVSYFPDVCENMVFDCIYSEHTSYHHIAPLMKFFDNLNMKIFRVQHIGNHGGSVRVFVCHADHYIDLIQESWLSEIEDFKYNEKNIDQKIKRLQKDIKLLGYELRDRLHQLKNKNKSIAIYGMPAKATTMLYALGIDEKIIDFAVDDNPLKQNTYSPGKNIPVYTPEMIQKLNPDVLLVLAWNFSESIIKNHSEFKGTWIIPLPEYHEIG